MVYEVEARSFISKEKYLELIDFFDKNSDFKGESYQETHYFDCEQDLRIQNNPDYCKIWLKKGKMHDEKRKEIEIRIDKNNFENLKELFFELGLNVKIKWFRKRREYFWKNCSVCIDFTKGYGYIIEIEKLCEEKNKEECLKDVKKRFEELKVLITSKEDFSKKFKSYEENWKELTKV